MGQHPAKLFELMIPESFQEEQSISFQKQKALKALKAAKELEQKRLEKGSKYVRFDKNTVVLKKNTNP